jgi:molybdenum cofactor cytidylyltransferase
MKASVQAALRRIEQYYAPRSDDAFLVAPADMPTLSPNIIDLLIETHANQPNGILTPTLAGRRGHPVLFPWSLAASVHALVVDEGLNALVQRHPPIDIPCDHLQMAAGDPFADIDTPEQFRRLAGEQP